MSKAMIHVQVYSVKPLEKGFRLNIDPYEAEKDQQEKVNAEIDRLKALGVIFLRDEDHSYAGVFEELTAPTAGFYSQFMYEEDTGIVPEDAWVQFNVPCRIQWMTHDRVNRTIN